MELTMSERKAVTKKLALEYRRGNKARKGDILDQICELNRWHRSHARKALKQASVLKAVKPRLPRPPIYGGSVMKALRFLWAVQGTPCGRLLAAAHPVPAGQQERWRPCGAEELAHRPPTRWLPPLRHPW